MWLKWQICVLSVWLRKPTSKRETFSYASDVSQSRNRAEQNQKWKVYEMMNVDIEGQALTPVFVSC